MWPRVNDTIKYVSIAANFLWALVNFYENKEEYHRRESEKQWGDLTENDKFE